MRDTELYSMLIYFFIFICIKKTLDLIIEFKYPTYKNLNEDPLIWKILVRFRQLFSFITLIVCFVFLYTFKLNNYLVIIFILFIINNFVYFFIEERLIYNIIPKKFINHEIIKFIDVHFGFFSNLLLSLYSFYVIINIFS